MKVFVFLFQVKFLNLHINSETMKEILEQRNKELSGNISNYYQNQIIIDQKDGQKCTIVKRTKTSICVHISKNEKLYDIEVKCDKCHKTSILKKEQSKRCKKNIKDLVEVNTHEWKIVDKICDGKLIETRKIYSGVDCNQWFDIKKFEERFTNLPYQSIPKNNINELIKDIILVRLVNQCNAQLDLTLVKNDTFLFNYISKRKKEYEEKLTKLCIYMNHPIYGEVLMFRLEKNIKSFYYPIVNKNVEKIQKIHTMKLATNLMEELTNKTCRSRNQTQFLFELCDFNFEKLVELERKLKNNFVMYVPGDKDEVNRILNLGEGKSWFKLEPRFEFVWDKNELPSVNEFSIEKKLRYKLLGYTNKFENFCYHLNWTGVYPLPIVKVEAKVTETKATFVKPVNKTKTVSFVKTSKTQSPSITKSTKKTVVSDAAARSMIGDFLKNQ